MQQLLNLTVTPAKLNLRADPGSLQYTHGTAELHLQRDRGGLTIDNQPIRLKLDTFDARNSIVPTAMTTIKQSAQKGLQAAGAAAASYAQQGKRAMQVPIGGEIITQVARETLYKNVKMNVGIQFLPTTGPKISWEPGSMRMQFEADRLKFNWQVREPQFRHSYAHVDVTMAQYPDVKVDYVRPPIKVPRSADPTYHPIDLHA